MDNPAPTKADRAKVERRHREAAVRLRYCSAFDIRPSYTDAYEAGLHVERRQDSVADRVLAELADIAQSHADFEAAGYARATADAKAFLASKELAAHQAQMREAEAALYDARLRIGCDEHVGAGEKGGGNG